MKRAPPALLALLLLTTPALAQQARLVLQRCPLAGFSHHAAAELWPGLREGDPLTLSHERTNPHDAQTVRVDWQGQALGYLPRTDNGAIARALARGQTLDARISRLREHPDPRKRIEIEVSALLPAQP